MGCVSRNAYMQEHPKEYGVTPHMGCVSRNV